MKLCEITKKKSAWIWNVLRQARLHKSKIGEESITDFFVLELKKESMGAYYIESFTRPKEKVTGADWELWFTGPSKKWIGLRVQAKVISLDAKRYAQLHYKRKDGTFQIDQLIADAKKHKATPLYCLYSNWGGKDAGKVVWSRGTVKRNIRLFGASIISVSNVQDMKTKRDDSLKSVAGHLSPLHCIFCCNGYGIGDLPTRVYAFLRSFRYINQDSNLLLEEPPYYVKQVLHGSLEGDLVDFQDENLSRITVIDENSEDNLAILSTQMR